MQRLGRGELGGIGFHLQKELNELIVQGGEYDHAKCSGKQIDQNFEAEGVAFSVYVLQSVKLCGKDAGRADRAEHQQVEDEDELIDDGNSGHGGGGDPTYHDVIKQIDQIGNAVLNDHGDCHGKHRVIEMPIPDVTAKELWLGHETPH